MTTVAYPHVDDRAPCRHGDPERYFPTGGDFTDIGKVCGGCPFIAPCLLYALHFEVAGIWGGTAAARRKELRKQAGITAVTLRFDHARCGTPSGYQRHRNAGEKPCGACTEASVAANRRRRHSA